MRGKELSISSGGRERLLDGVHAPLSRGRGRVLMRAGRGLTGKGRDENILRGSQHSEGCVPLARGRLQQHCRRRCVLPDHSC